MFTGGSKVNLGPETYKWWRQLAMEGNFGFSGARKQRIEELAKPLGLKLELGVKEEKLEVTLRDRKGNERHAWELSETDLGFDHGKWVIDLLIAYETLREGMIAGADPDMLNRILGRPHGYRIEMINADYVAEDLEDRGYEITTAEVLDLIEEHEARIYAATVGAWTDVIANAIERARGGFDA